MLSQTTVGWGVFGVDEDEPVSEVFDGGGQVGVTRSRRCIRAGGEVRDELTEESEGGIRDIDIFLLLPDGESVIELLGNGEDG